MADDSPTIRVILSRADAIVLFDWLIHADLNAIPITHPAQKQALADLLYHLETATDVGDVTHEKIGIARTEVARDMGW